MRISSINGSSGRTLLLLGVILFWGVSSVRAAACSTSKGFPSNNIRWLIGRGDTLWMGAGRDHPYSLSMLAGSEAISHTEEESNWWSYSSECREDAVFDLETAGGHAVASIDLKPNVLWLYTFATGKMKDYSLQWPKADTTYDFTVLDIAYSNKHFYCAAYNGGMLRWNHLNNDKRVFFPGKDTSYELGSLKLTDIPAPDSMTALTGVESLVDDSLLLVTTPERIWLFSIKDSTWDSVSVSDSLAEKGASITQFESSFVNKLDSALPLYAIIDVRLDKSGTDTSWLCKYNRRSQAWELLLKQAPKSISFGWNNTMFMLFSEDRPGGSLDNIIRLYRALPGDTGCLKTPAPFEDEQYFKSRMTRRYNIDFPDELNDILFVPKTDSTGYLWLATSEGLFFHDEEKAGTDTASFQLIKRAPPVNAGLKKTYARPGIITPTSDGCVFIYNIKKASAKVTIRVYDYNMDLVKTIIEKRPRLSGKNGGPLGRSTVESEDFWDGKNKSGRYCAPGIYYYKITTDSGERAFGKVVIAR